MSKFIKYILFCFLIMFVSTANLKAIELSANKSTVNVGETFEITVKNPGSNSGYNLSYESTYYSDVVNSCRGRGDRKDADQDKMPCVIKYTVKSGMQLTSSVKTQISISDVGNSAGESDTIEITINKSVNSTTGSSSDSSSTTTTKKTTTTTKNEKSDNAFLKSISVLDNLGAEILMTPEFKKDVYEYTLEVSGDVDKVTVNSQAEDSKANIILSSNATEELKAGENNKITITVTAESGAQKAYVLNIKKEALNTDATLSKLTIDESPSFKFSEEKYEYNINIDKAVEKLTIRYILSDEKATIDIIGNENLEDGSIVKLLVTAPDGTKKEYKLNIVKQEITTTKKIDQTSSDKNPIVILILSMIAFTLLGSIIYVTKKK